MPRLQETGLEQGEEKMSRFDETMLQIHSEAKKLAFADAEKILFAEKDFRSLEKLQQMKEDSGLNLITDGRKNETRSTN